MTKILVYAIAGSLLRADARQYVFFENTNSRGELCSPASAGNGLVFARPAKIFKTAKGSPFGEPFAAIASIELQTVLLVELINAAAGVNELLLAGVEGVALGADFNGDVLLGAAGFDDLAASAADGGLFVVGMDSGLHN